MNLRRKTNLVHLVGVFFPILVLLVYLIQLVRHDLLIFMEDTCLIFEHARQLVHEHRFPLVGNPIYYNYRLGPLADILTAIPIYLFGSMLSTYYFMWLLSLLSLPVFYLAILRRFGNAWAAFFGTLWFLISFLFPDYLLATPWNTSFLPLFLAGFTYFLFSERQKANLPILYFMIGLCMQLHFTALLLIPGAIVFLWKSKNDFLAKAHLHLLGILIVLLLHASVVYSLATDHSEMLHPVDYVTDHYAARFDWGYVLKSLPIVAGILSPLLLFVPLIVYLPGTTRKRALAEIVKPMLASAFYVLAIVAINGLKKDDILPSRYFLPLLPFFAFLAGVLIDQADALKKRKLFCLSVLFLPLLILSVLILGFFSMSTDHGVQNGTRLSENLELVESMHQKIRVKQITDISSMTGNWYVLAPDRLYTTPTGRDCLWTAYCIQHPEWCHRITGANHFDLFVLRDTHPKTVIYGKELPMPSLRISLGCEGPYPLNDRRYYLCSNVAISDNDYCQTQNPMGIIYDCRGSYRHILLTLIDSE